MLKLVSSVFLILMVTGCDSDNTDYVTDPNTDEEVIAEPIEDIVEDPIEAVIEPIEDTSEYAVERTQLLALGNLTDAPAIRDETGALTTIQAGDFKTIYFDVLDYLGDPTRAYAWIGIPETAAASSPVPAVVLVHGGGGTAYSEWVEQWTERGYAAIAIAVEGQTDEENETGGWKQHEWAGPARTGIYNNIDYPLEEQWMYHAVADTIIANSLMRSLEFIDNEHVGLTGISWGGVISATVMGIDSRFDFIIPIYGCGDMDNADNWWGDTLSTKALYQEVWDPMQRMESATMPSLWISFPEEANFPIERQAISYRGTPGERLVTLVSGMGHSHKRGWLAEESYDFADSIIANDSPWIAQTYLANTDGEALVKFVTEATLSGADLISTSDEGVTTDRTWTTTSASLEDNGSGEWQVSATLPADVTGWYISVYSGDLVVSSGYQGDEGGTDISPYMKVNEGSWQNVDYLKVSVGDEISFAPHPNTTGSWHWTGPNSFTASNRTPNIENMQSVNAGNYIATYTDADGYKTLRTFTVDVD